MTTRCRRDGPDGQSERNRYASILPILLLGFLAYQSRQAEASAAAQVETVVRDD